MLYFSDGVLVGSADTFYHNEVFTFPVPYNEDTRCDTDFLVLLRTDSYPTETTWRVTNASGQTVVSGKFSPFNDNDTSLHIQLHTTKI